MSKRAPIVMEDDSGDDAPPRKRVARPKKLPLPLYKATVAVLADTGPASSHTADIDGVIERIQKCLARAEQPNAAEREAKAAFRVAAKLMMQYNVSQADLLAHVPAEKQKEFAGRSVVSIRRWDDDESKPVRLQAYAGKLCRAMRTFFDCKDYSTATAHSIDLTFYGIANNTVAAAMAFESAYNLIAEWARSKKGVGSKNSYCLGASNELIVMSSEAKAQEEAQAQEKEEEEIAARERQEKIERAAQIERLAPLPLTPIVPSSPEVAEGVMAMDSDHSDDEGSEIEQDLPDLPADEMIENEVEPDFKIEDEGNADDIEDLDEEINRHIKIKVEPTSSEEASPRWESLPTFMPGGSTILGARSQGVASLDFAPPSQMSDDDSADIEQGSTQQSKAPTLPTSAEPGSDDNPSGSEHGQELSYWTSQKQLVLFRATAEKIADDYLKERGVKIYKGRKRHSQIQDWTAYSHGRKDGKKIDVHQKTIKEEPVTEWF